MTNESSKEGLQAEGLPRENIAGPESSERLPIYQDATRNIQYLRGWRLQAVNFSVCMCLILSDIEITIVSTSLVSITNELSGFDRSSWIVTAYLTCFTGFLIIIAKLSDVYGRKAMLVFSIVFFIVFSIACGCAQTFTQLAVFRALQGIGGGGMHTLAWVILPEMIPHSKYPLYSAIVSSSFAISSIIGPLIGGAINSNDQWRWIFLLNAPAGAVTLLAVLIAMPWNFPFLSAKTTDVYDVFTIKGLKKIEFIGATLLLAATVLCVTALEEGGTISTWSDVLPIVLINNAGWLFLAFIVWQATESSRNSPRESIMPWRILKNRFTMGTLLNSFFAGAVFFAIIITFPQYLQLAFNFSPFQAGYHMLVLTILVPVGAGVGAQLTERYDVPPLYMLTAGGVFQAIGVGLLLSISTEETSMPPEQYGYLVILGLGFGLGLGTVVMLTTIAFEPRDIAVAMGAVAQFRCIGAALVLSICATVLRDRVTSEIGIGIDPAQVARLLRSADTINELPASGQTFVRQIYARGFVDQLYVMLAFSISVLFATLLLVERKPRTNRSRM